MMPEVDHRPLAERYRPLTLKEVAGNAHALEELLRWGRSWARGTTPPRHRAVFLEGPPGVGKTTAALALAADLGWTVVEMNASDARNQSAVEQVAGRAAATQTLGVSGRFRTYASGARTLILLDEADALTGRLAASPTTRSKPVSFRDFVRSRYQSLDAVAKAWGLGEPGAPAAFERWEQIPATGGRGAWSRRPAAQRDLSEWRSARVPSDVSDRGGLPAILRLIPETRQPIVLTVNDWTPYARAGAEFRRVALRIRFDGVSRPELEGVLRRVIAKERYVIAREALEVILDRSQGDVRSALNDLDAIAPLPPGPAQREVLSPRDRPADFFAVTDDALRNPRYYRAGEIRARLDATPDDLLPWIEENVPRVAATTAALVGGVNAAAKAERYLALARRQRVWALWSFASELMTGGTGLAMARASAPDVARPLAFPQFLGTMGRTRVARATRTSIARKAGRTTHISGRKAADIELPWLEAVFRLASGRGAGRTRWRALQALLVEQFQLTPEEMAFLEARAGSVSDEKADGPTPGKTPVRERPEPPGPSEASPKLPPEPAPAATPSKHTQRSLENF